MGTITNLYTCPTCSRSIAFGSPVNNMAVCTCGAVWERRQERLEPLVLPIIDHSEDYIRPGTTGTWQGKTFIVTGRFRAWFDETVYNYWSIDMGDSRKWYLGEGYGLYAIYELRESAIIDRHALQRMKGANRIMLEANQSFDMTRRCNGRYLDIEGAFYKPGGTQKVSTYECAGGIKKVEIFEYAPDEIEVYTLHPVAVTTLNLQHTRDTERTGKSFTCKTCGQATTVRTYPYAQSWVCTCGDRYALQNTTQVKRSSENNGITTTCYFKLGSPVKLFDITYTVIGFASKVDYNDSSATWREYTLYNKIQGYVFLNESDGHWMLLREMQETPTVEDAKKHAFYYNNKEFEIFLQYRSRILYAAGEFPGNVFNDDYDALATDFISQPDIWSVEQHWIEGTTWYYGQYIDKSLLRKQAGAMPYARGVAPAQEKMRADMPSIIRAMLVVLGLFILVQYATVSTNSEQELLNNTFTLSDSTVTQTFISDTFKLKKWKSNLEFEIAAPVDNTWFELNATLVNAATGDEYSLEQGIEYYHGISDGESWSEGSTRESAYLSSIPAGTYFLQISSSRDMNVTSENTVRDFSLRVVNDSPMYRNFWLIGLIIILWPVIMLIMNHYYEKERWRHSPYSKFSYENK